MVSAPFRADDSAVGEYSPPRAPLCPTESDKQEPGIGFLTTAGALADSALAPALRHRHPGPADSTAFADDVGEQNLCGAAPVAGG